MDFLKINNYHKLQETSILSNMKYKALMLDLDGTTIPAKRNGIPSKKVSEAIEKASKKLHVGIATSRCLYVAKNVTKHLKLFGPSILNGGGQIIDFPSEESLAEQVIQAKDITRIIDTFNKFKITFVICDGKHRDRLYKSDRIPSKSVMIFSQGLEKEQSKEIIDDLSHLPAVSIYTTSSWKKDKTDVLITHVKATKQHGIFEVAKILGIQTHEIIGVGDGYNDFPLLMACGLKVAMGNAVDDLKAIADYIAPTVEEDGVADVIEKFIL